MRASFIHITQGFHTSFEIVAEKDLLPRILASASSSPLESRDELDNISYGLAGQGIERHLKKREGRLHHTRSRKDSSGQHNSACCAWHQFACSTYVYAPSLRPPKG